MIMKCKICNSPYLDYVNSLSKKGMSSRKIAKLLNDEFDFKVSHRSVCDHKKNHLLAPILEKDDLIKLLYKTGNYRLAKSVMRTQKIIKQYRKCLCNPFNVRPLRKKGLVFICTSCFGWVEGNVGRAIRKEEKRQRRSKRERLGFVVRRRKRF